jgi:hypothetical protein
MSMSNYELLRSLELIFDNSADPRLLLPFLSPTADAESRLQAVLLCSRVARRDEDIVVALVCLLKSRDKFPSLIEPLVEALTNQFSGQEEHLANVLSQLGCIPQHCALHPATSQDLIYLACLYNHAVGPHLRIVSLESMVSDALWSNNWQLSSSALLAAKAICAPPEGGDAEMVKELLFGCCHHTNARIKCIARAILWECAVQGSDDVLLGQLMSDTPQDPASQTVNTAGIIFAHLTHNDTQRSFELLLSLMQRSSSSQQDRALLEAFVTHRLSVETAGSCIIFALSRLPQYMSLLISGSIAPVNRQGLSQLYRMCKRNNAEDDLCAAIVEELPQFTPVWIRDALDKNLIA